MRWLNDLEDGTQQFQALVVRWRDERKIRTRKLKDSRKSPTVPTIAFHGGNRGWHIDVFEQQAGVNQINGLEAHRRGLNIGADELDAIQPLGVPARCGFDVLRVDVDCDESFNRAAGEPLKAIAAGTSHDGDTLRATPLSHLPRTLSIHFTRRGPARPGVTCPPLILSSAGDYWAAEACCARLSRC